ncbi:MAG: LEPR-XLL domain-containing protein, partial [bacterium]|nr:LEPR-XLL domain-containing protein [bacterium]
MPANHFNSKHGAGRGRSLRTGLAKYMPRKRRRRTRRRKFLAEQLEARLLLAADLTVITHGRMDQIFADPDVAPEWAFDLASAINERDALGFSQDQIDNSVMRYDATDYSPPANGASAFLIFNWAEISDIDSPGKADDDEVAGVLADMVRARYPSNGDPIDIHFIGHSRGSYVTLETVNRLNTSADNARIGELSMTTLDPQDYGIPGLNEENIELVVPSNVDFAENYYQSLFPLGGGEMQGADIDQSLTIPLALWDGRSVLLGAEHLEVVDHYYWSIDTDDSTSASYLRDSDLQDQQAVFEAEIANGVTETRDLLYGESPLVRRIEESAAILEGIAQEFGDGVGEFFTEFTDRLETVFGEVEVPIISDQLSQIISPVVDDLKNFGADVRDLLGDVVEVASRTLDSDPLEVLQGAMYLVLGPGSEGLEDLSDAAAYALAPLASRFDRINLGLLLDRSDAGDDIGPSDVVITTGNEFGVYDDDNLLGSGEAPWFQLDFRIGQFEVIDLPKFDLGLESLSQNAALQAFFDTFGFQVTSENGLRTNLRWDLRMGLGVRGLPGQLITERIFFNSGATGSGLDTGNGVDEFQASITVFAAPPNSRGSETFATSIADSTTTDDLRGEVNLGLFQGTITDGTAFKVKITATQGVDFEDFDGPNSLTIVVNEGLTDQRTIVLTAPDPTADLVTFLLDLNGQLIDEYGGIPEVGFTVDFGSVHRQVYPAIPTTPSLVLAANDPDIQSLTIRGGQKYKFLAEQYEDGRSTTLGFGNNVSSDEDDDGDNTRLTATLPIPANGVSMAKPNFVLWIGGERNAQDGRLLDDATSVVVAEALNGDVASLDGLQQNMALLRRINSPEAYRAAIEQLIQSLVDSQTNFGRDAVRVELVTINGKQHLQLVSDQRLTVTYKGIEQTQLTLTAGIDIQDPNFDPALLEQNPNDEAYFNRLTISEIRSNDITDVFSPVLKGEATVRLHVDTNTDTLDGFLEQALGVSDATLGLPTVDFDFIFDAAIDFTEFFGEGTSELDDIFSIDALQFDNVVLDAEALVQNVIVPIIDTVFSAFEPVFEIFGDVADDAEALLNQRIPVVSDLVGEDITVMSILEEIGLDEFLTALLALPGLPADLIEAAEDPSFGAFNLGGWELVMDPDSPLFFPDIDLPVPIDLAYAYNTLEAVEALDFLSVFTALDTFKASGLSIDIFKPKSIINMAIGQPFDIISYGLPNINIDTGAEFDFDWKVIDFAASANLILQSRLRVVYDSLGIEKIVDAFRENATPDWSDLIDGFGITTVSADEDIEDPDTDHECEKDFEKEIYICIALEAQGGVDIGVAEGSGGIAIQADLGLDLEDPDEDGKLRLDEILDITNDFANPENLFCIFDIEGSASLDLNGSFTVAGIEIFDGEFDWDSGDLSLQDLLSSLFNICTDEVPSPILAQEIVEGTDTVLRLNTGPFASARLYEDTDDSDGRVEYTVTQQNSTYSITAVLYPGGESYTQEITGDFDRIVATGSRFGDTFNLSGVATSVHIDGRDGNDTLIGGTGADRLEGSAGDDNLQGGGGNDMLLPGRGRNQVSDGPGDDEVDFRLNDVGVVYTTGGGSDIVRGSRYDDDIRAGAGSAAVRFEGGRGNDILVGGDSADTLMGGDGDDLLQGLGGNDILVGGFGNDTLLGGTGADTLDGGQGDDVLDGGAGADSLEAGQGNDEVTAGLQDVMVQGGSG